MKRFLKRLLIAAVVVGLAFAACQPMIQSYKAAHKKTWRLAKVSRGRIVHDVQATGTVKPVLEVSVGSFVSGPITELHADFNQTVKKGDLLAQIDRRLYEASKARDSASLETRQADVQRANALYQQAVRNEKRAVALREENKDFISQREMDAFHFERMSLEAQLKVAKAAVVQAQAALETSLANLNYTEIRSPVDGMITDRKISPGETLATQFQMPVLFIVAPDMDKEMHVFATVDEADVGRIIQAKEKSLPVEFTVTAYPEERFSGTIQQIRKNATTTENVVTYPVIVSAPNPDLKLLPFMTANISFQIDERKDAIRIPNAALRFFPANEAQVREQDREIFSGTADEEEEDERVEAHMTDEEREAARKKRNRRHVWVAEGEFLKAVEVEIGLVSLKYTEMVEGNLKEGDELVIGERNAIN